MFSGQFSRANGEWRGATLSEFVERFYYAEFKPDSKRRTRDAHRQTLVKWRRLVGDPPLARIDSAMIARFREGLIEGGARKAEGGRRQLELFPPAELPLRRLIKPQSKSTSNKDLRHLRAFLNAAVSLNVLDRAPRIVMWRLPRRLPRLIDPRQIETAYRGAEFAQYPFWPGISAAHWWQAFILMYYVAAIRLGALVQLDARQPEAINWEAIDWQRCQIRVPAEADKCNQERRKALHPIVLKHLLRIRHAGRAIFEWPMAPRTFYREWYRLQSCGGAKPGEFIRPHDLKRACATQLAEEGASPHEIMQQLDHSSLQTSLWYVNATHGAKKAVERMALPAAFFEAFGDGEAGSHGVGG